MFMEERQRGIMERLQERGKITIAEIAQVYGVSDESARRDLRLLEQQGLCKRTHGGAILPQQINRRPPQDRSYEHMPIDPHYRGIARRAVAMIRPGDVVYLTGGSFGYIMAQLLPADLSCTLVVNNVEVARALRPLERAEVYLAGGRMRRSGSLVDSMATVFVSGMHFDLCFLTGAGLTATFGLSNGTDETAAFQRAVLRNSRRRCLLMPSAKIGADAFIRVCEAEAFHEVITDWDCAEDHLSALEDKGLQVTAVEMPRE